MIGGGDCRVVKSLSQHSLVVVQRDQEGSGLVFLVEIEFAPHHPSRLGPGKMAPDQGARANSQVRYRVERERERGREREKERL